MTLPASIPADDRGLLLGVGLFETVLFVDGAPRLWRPHVERLYRGCVELALPAPEADELRAAAAAALHAAGVAAGRAAVRLTWTGGSGGRGLSDPAAPRPRLLASAAASLPPPAALTLATSGVRRNPSSPTSRLKTLSYLDNVAARREATAAGADEALLLDTAGRVACAAAGNVFWLEGDRLCTPSTACGVLPGVMRAELLARAPHHGLRPCPVEAGPERMRAAEAVLVTNSLIGAAPVRALDGAGLPAPPPFLQALCDVVSG